MRGNCGTAKLNALRRDGIHLRAMRAFRTPLFTIGFRPLYLLAALFAALSVPLWAARFAGWLGEWVYFSESVWHAHEMIFGYALAVVVGFLFTAVRNWTGRPRPPAARSPA